MDGQCSVKLRNLFPACPTNCSYHGQCNNLKKCHCDPLFEPRLNCSVFGSGGSEDGGPNLDPSGFLQL